MPSGVQLFPWLNRSETRDPLIILTNGRYRGVRKRIKKRSQKCTTAAADVQSFGRPDISQNPEHVGPRASSIVFLNRCIRRPLSIPI